MSPAFGGEVAGYYANYRRGYDASAIDWLVNAFVLGNDDTVIDLGCGTGQLAIPLSSSVRAVVGIDPEPDMLARAAQEATAARLTNISWVLGTERDLSAVEALLGEGSIAAVVVGNAVHLMDHELLFRTLTSLLRPRGGVALLANGTPLWQQDSDCSRAVRGVLEEWFATELTSMCGTDQSARQQYAGALRAAGYTDVEQTVLGEYADELDIGWVIGHLYSAIPQDQLPRGARRAEFERRILDAVGPHASFTEHVRVSALTGRAPVR